MLALSFLIVSQYLYETLSDAKNDELFVIVQRAASKFGIDADTIELLGGNQHNAVNFSRFRVSSIVDIRWLGVTPTPDGGGSSVLEQLASPDDADR
jgi:hypothetical protein